MPRCGSGGVRVGVGGVCCMDTTLGHDACQRCSYNDAFIYFMPPLSSIVKSYHAWNARQKESIMRETPRHAHPRCRTRKRTLLPRTRKHPLPRTRKRPITPRTRMPAGPQQRPRLVQGPADRDTAAPGRTCSRVWTRLARRQRRRRRATHARRGGDAHGRRPAAHPPAHAPPVQALAARDAVVVDGDQDAGAVRVGVCGVCGAVRVAVGMGVF